MRFWTGNMPNVHVDWPHEVRKGLGARRMCGLNKEKTRSGVVLSSIKQEMWRKENQAARYG